MTIWHILLLSFFFSDLLLAFGLFRKTYDAYTHIFFASHYAHSWFDSWNPRWFGGFDQLGYPPLTHQLIALASPWFGLDFAYGVVQLSASLLITVGIYRFVRDVTSEEIGRDAALLSVFSTVLIQAAHMFGQLPMLLSLGVLLNGLAYLTAGVRSGNRWTLACGLVWLCLVAAVHHVTLFFGVLFFVAPVCWYLVFEDGSYSAARLKRIAIYGVLCLLLSAALVSPFLSFVSSAGASQVEIPHGTRNNFFADKNSLIYFFLVPYSTMLFVIPFVIPWALKLRHARPFAITWIVLFLLGLGGSTPVARWVLGKQFNTLTMDRFTLWSIVILHLLVPAYFVTLQRKKLFRGFVLATAAAALLLSTAVRLFPFQPEAIDMEPLVQFLDEPQHREYRYLTLGFGSQFGWLGAQTQTPSIDGNYFTARLIPELRASGIESLDGAKYFGRNGEKTLDAFLKGAPRFALKYVFSADAYYDPALRTNGWKPGPELTGNVRLWVRDGVPPVRENDVVQRVHHPAWMLGMFGSYPLLLVIALVLSALEWKRRTR